MGSKSVAEHEVGVCATGPDLSDKVTVFLSTIGAPSLEACLAHLSRQDCAFRFEVIEFVAPLNAAFQQMIDACTTPYYLQVDEDMILFPHAVRQLYEEMSLADDLVALCSHPLWDVHLERCINGIKIYRHALVRNYPYRAVEGCEGDQTRRLQADGFIYLRTPPEAATRTSPETLGLHGTHWTPRAIYERFCTLERKRCKGKRAHDYLLDYPQILLDRYLKKRHSLDLYALMGLIAGRLANHQEVGREKDFRTYDSLPGYDAMRRYLDEVSDASYEKLSDLGGSEFK